MILSIVYLLAVNPRTYGEQFFRDRNIKQEDG